jgi:hypothetical protein
MNLISGLFCHFHGFSNVPYSPKRRLQADDKVEPWWPTTWPQKNKLNRRGDFSPSPKRRLQADDKVEPWWPTT